VKAILLYINGVYCSSCCPIISPQKLKRKTKVKISLILFIVEGLAEYSASPE
jgi:hypothetical protein